MIVFRSRLSPEKMFPAGDARFRVSFVRTASDVRVRVAESGPVDGAPVFMIPGWGCSVWVYRDLLPALGAAGYRAIAAELQGHGLSDKPTDPRAYTAESMTRHVVEILDALDVDRPVIGGHSMGAALAAGVALRNQSRFRALILLSPVGMTGFELIGVLRAATPRFLRRAMPHLTPRWFFSALLWFVYGRRSRPTPESVDQYWAPTQFPQYSRAIHDLLHVYEWGTGRPLDLKELTLPVLYVRGTRDRLLLRSRAEHDSRLIPNARVHWIRDAGHTIAEETPDEVNTLVVDFLKTVVGF